MEKYIKEALLRSETNFNFGQIVYNKNLHLEILEKYPDKDWSWFYLHENPNFGLEWLRRFPNKNWNWKMISKLIKWDWIDEFPDKNWDWIYLTKFMKDKELKKYSHKPLDWVKLTLSDRFDVNYMIENPDFPWIIHELFFTSIDGEILDFLRYFSNRYNIIDWIDHTTHCTWDVIKKNMDLPWVKSYILFEKYTDGDIDIIKSNPGGWDMDTLSTIVPVDIILENIDLNWNFKTVSINSSLTYKQVEDNPHLDWDYNNVPVNLNIDKWFASNTIKRYWKKCVSDPSYEMCRKVLLYNFNNLNGSFPHSCGEQPELHQG